MREVEFKTKYMEFFGVEDIEKLKRPHGEDNLVVITFLFHCEGQGNYFIQKQASTRILSETEAATKVFYGDLMNDLRQNVINVDGVSLQRVIFTPYVDEEES